MRGSARSSGSGEMRLVAGHAPCASRVRSTWEYGRRWIDGGSIKALAYHLPSSIIAFASTDGKLDWAGRAAVFSIVDPAAMPGPSTRSN